MQNFKTTADIKVPDKLIDQVIGQKAATEIVKKASRQRRNILLIGDPGTGKTMLAQAMAELLPATELEDILAYKNPNDENMPLIKDVKTYPNEEARLKKGDGQGRQILQKERMKNRMGMNRSASMVTPIILMLVIVLFGLSLSGLITGYEIIVLAALMLGILIFGSMIIFMTSVTRRGGGFPGMGGATDEPKLIVDNTGYVHAPFIDATGSRAGALFGDVRHDPLQCIPAGEAVLLANGEPIPIEKLIDPYFVEESGGEINVDLDTKILGGIDNKFKFAPAKVTKVYRRSYNGKVICIKTRNGSKIRVTPNHPIATISTEGGVIYVEAGSVPVDSRIASKERMHSEYPALNSKVEYSKNLAVVMLAKLAGIFLTEGAYAFDKIVEVKSEDYSGFVYNLTTETGNYLVDFVLTHNTGGLGTPAHLRVESGAVHKANKGVLFIDEVSRLEPKSQQDLLTSLQEKKYPITGQSEMSSGALVKTEPVPADFILVAAGNLQDIQNMHPALRSRIRGYGYEVYMESTMEDNEANRTALLQFIAQEIRKDGKIPHFDKGAVEELFEEARRRAGRKKRLTLILRDLGGLIRAAGDIAIENNKKIVTKEDIIAAHRLANSIEAQVVNQEIEYRKDYKVFGTRGFSIGKVNGLAVIGSSTITSAGIVLPIVAEVTPASSRSEGKFIPTGKLGKIANEAVKNVSAIIKKHMGRDVANYDMHVQFLQSYTGVEGDSASISVAISIISAMENLPVDQSMAMTGSLSVRGQVLPVGGITSKVEAAINAGMRAVIIPASNIDDVYLSKPMLKRIKIIPVRTLGDVIRYSIKQSKRKNEIIKELHKHESAMGDSK